VIVVQLPVPGAHAWQTPLHVVVAQQNPSLHTPVVHCAFCVHAPPAAVCGTQVAEPLQ
jgi:hypothetical protein